MTGAPQGLQDILPLSPLQQGLYFLSSYDDSALDVYNVQLGLDLTGPLDTDRLRRMAVHRCRRSRPVRWDMVGNMLHSERHCF